MDRQQGDSLDNFFLNRVENYQIDYRESDWHKLSELLDASDAMKAAAFRQRAIWIGSGVLLALCIALLIWMSQNLNGTKQNNLQKEVIEEDRVTAITDDIKQAQTEGTTLKSMEILDRESSLMEVESGQTTTNKKENNNGNGGPPPAADGNHADTNADEESDIALLSVIHDQRDLGKHDDSISEDISTRESHIGNESAISLSLQDPGIERGETNLNDLVFERVDSGDEYNFKKNYAWNFGVAADFSAVGVSDFDGPSLRVGLSFEYYILENLSILAGVNYSEKKYSAYGREYSPPYGYWTRGIVPDETYGECNVVDIPINVTYYIPNLQGQAFFIRTGISSWLMLEEHYYYEYDNNNDPDLKKYWGGENENYHYFSIINLSAGFEHPLSSKVSLLAEPYFNIPLAGVGFGAVDLHSAGLKLTFKVNHYKLISKK